MLLIALLLAADVVPLTQESQVKDLCNALREQAFDAELDPAQVAAAVKVAQARREEAAGHWYRIEVPSKGFAFGRYSAQDKQLEQFGNDLVSGTANISLTQRMVTGAPSAPGTSN